LSPSVVGQRVFQLRDRAEVAGFDFGHAGLRLTLEQQEMAEALGEIAGLVVTVRIGLERAGHDAEHRDATREWIRDRLPHERPRRRSVVGSARRFRAILADRAKRPVKWRRQVGEHRVEERLDAHVQRGRRADQREDFSGQRGGAQAGDQFVVGQRAGLEEFLHQCFVVLGDHLDQHLARRVDVGDHLCRQRCLGELAALVGLEDPRLAGHEVDDALEASLDADWQLDRRHRPAARLAQRRQRPVEARAFAIQAVHHDQSRQFQLVGNRPDLLGLHHHAGDRVDDDQRAVGDVKRRLRIAQEVAHPRRVDEVDLLLVPLGIGQAGRQRVLADDFFFVVVGDGRSIVDLAEAIDHAGIGEDGGGELGLARSAVTDEGDIPNAGGVVDLHRRLSQMPKCNRVVRRIIFPRRGGCKVHVL
jgi:hypothetical protein